MQATSTKSGPPSNSSSQGNNTSAQGSTSSTVSGTAAESFVKEFYGKYAVFGSDRLGLIKQYGTATLLAAWNAESSAPAGSDPVDCAQSIPMKVTVTGHTSTSSGVNVSAKEDFGETSSTLVVAVVDQNGLKVDHVVCPAP
jgi:hypothetical protein